MTSALCNRRSFVKGMGGAVAVVSLVPAVVSAQTGLVHNEGWVSSIKDSSVKSLVFTGVQSALDNGAQYSDVRLTNHLMRDVTTVAASDYQTLHASVRAYYNGSWGIAAGPMWSYEQLAQLGKRAASQAKLNASLANVGSGPGRNSIPWSDLPQVPVISDGHWDMPVAKDPLAVSPYEMQDHFMGVIDAALDEFSRRSNERANIHLTGKFVVQERAWGSSDDSYCTQRLYQTTGSMTTSLVVRTRSGDQSNFHRAKELYPAGRGWEHFTKQSLASIAVKQLREMRADIDLPTKPVDIGKFNVALDAYSMGGLLSQTIGVASEVDRALNYEANATGMTYLNKPANMLDSLQIGSDLLSVTANRSEAGGAATVRWDDEGIEPSEFPIIENGIFRNYQLSREGVVWLKSAGVTGRDNAHGVMSSARASDKPQVNTANLKMTPSSEQIDESEVLKRMNTGLLVEDLYLNIDSHQLNGMMGGARVYQIKDGKKVARVYGCSVHFHTPDLWKSMFVTGGSDTSQSIGFVNKKGDNEKESCHTVTSVPAAFSDQSVTEVKFR